MALFSDNIDVVVGAKGVSAFQSGMKRASGSMGDFDNRIAVAGKRIATVAAGIAASVAAIGVAGLRMSANAARSAREIQNLANLAGTSAEEFQRLAEASRSVGIEQDKLSDILKDVNDKVGDFIATGGGPMKDFFEEIAPQVGVTADQFARLSGPEALQLYVDSLEKAGASQQQMTFYMEALASDATALLPLLRDNGAEMRKLGDEAERSGRILGNDMVRSGAELDRKLDDMSRTIRANLNSALLENSDELIALAGVFSNVFIPALGAVGSVVGAVVEHIAGLVRQIQAGVAAVRAFNAAADRTPSDAIAPDVSQTLLTERFEGGALDGNGASSGDIREFLNRPGSDTGTPLSTGGDLLPPALDPGPTFGSSGGSAGGGGGAGDAELEMLRRRYADQAALVEEQREDALERLREYRENKKVTEEEYNTLEENIMRDHAERLAEIQRRAQEQRLRDISGALGDVATLMQSENKKLFKIGQAAAIADAVVNGYSAAVAAWEKGMKIGGPPVAAAFTAASLARTGALISGIASASPSGSGSAAVGGAGSGAGGPAGSATDQRGGYVNIQLVGGNQYGPDAIRQLAASLNEFVEGGGTLKGVRVV